MLPNPARSLFADSKRVFDAAALQKAIAEGCLPSLCNFIDIHAGDVVFIPAGTIHATLSGTLLYEIQQSSDTTFRFYDWNRTGNDGKPRSLHIDQALKVLDTTYHNRHIIQPVILQKTEYVTRAIRVACRYFALEDYTVQQSQSFVLPPRKSFQVITVLKGTITINTAESVTAVTIGNSALIPADCSLCTIEARTTAQFLVSYVPDIAIDIVEPLKACCCKPDAIEQLGGNPVRNDIRHYL